MQKRKLKIDGIKKMKQVKECPECGRYNHRRRESCEKCGCRLSGVQIIEVDENLNENPDFGLVVQPQDDGQGLFIEEQNKKYVCNVCGVEYSIKRPDNVQYCEVCKHLVYNPFNKLNAIEATPQSSPIASSEQTHIVPQFINMNFLSTTGAGSFCLSFDAEPKSFGRSACEIGCVSANNFISREHISYFLKDGNTFVVDISTNGTYINGIKLNKGEVYSIKAGDLIRFYIEEFKVEDGN